jgi:arsenite methyltransferase
MMMSARPQGKFGIDAPWVPWLWVAITAATVVITVLFAAWDAGWWTTALTWYFGACAVVYLIGAALYWHASLRGKFTIWTRLLGGADLSPNVCALDLGCGRGAVAIMTALRFPQARVTGIDLWRIGDQSGNSLTAASHNVALNGVAERVSLDTGDMTDLPYHDGQFDLVTASLSLHNIPTEQDRRTAIREAVRVLAPGGRLYIVDIRRTDEYADELRTLGLTTYGPSNLGWRSWWTGPWMAASSIHADKTD